MYELVLVSIVTTIGGIIGLLLYQRGSISTWAHRMDYKQAEYEHKEKLEGIKKTSQLKMQKLKQNNPKETGDLITKLIGNTEISDVEGIIDKVTDLVDGTGEDSWLGSLLPYAKGLLKGATKKGEDEDEEIIR
jgi:hypothetical protein